VALPAIASFTGSRHGLSSAQEDTLARLLERDMIQVLVHGDCVGADEQADRVAQRLGIARWIFPGDIPKFRAHCEQHGALVKDSPESPLVRNRRIVRCAPTLYVGPAGFSEELYSGTWACCREARKARVPQIAIIWPDGTEADGRRPR